MKKRVATIAQILVGLVFLVSAFAKAWGGNAFANLVIQYGADWLTVFVPIVIAIETGLAAMLLLGIYTKKASLGAAIFVVGISLVYLYGVLVKGITDCGCFGVLHALNMRPLGTFIRNIILIGLCMVGYCCDTNQRLSTWWKVLVMLVLLVSSSFICGLDMSKAFQLPKINIIHRQNNLTLEQSGLCDILPLSSDSCYVVYLFSYTCAYCQNSFANVEQYQLVNEIDGVYGLAVENVKGEERFKRLYHPTIPIYNIPESAMAKLAGELPMLLVIEHGEIVQMQVGSVSSPLIMVP